MKVKRHTFLQKKKRFFRDRPGYEIPSLQLPGRTVPNPEKSIFAEKKGGDLENGASVEITEFQTAFRTKFNKKGKSECYAPPKKSFLAVKLFYFFINTTSIAVRPLLSESNPIFFERPAKGRFFSHPLGAQ